jgi:hypothetical protein
MSTLSPASSDAAASANSIHNVPPLLPPLPPGPLPQQPAPPHIAQLLYREGDAWTSVLNLHSNVIQNIQLASSSIANESVFDSDSERELQYVAALSQAAAQCDQLHAELVRLRTLRKARKTYDISALQPLIQAHTSETLAIGTSIASQVSITVQTVAAELRSINMEIKKTEKELTSLYEMLASSPLHTLPSDFEIRVTYHNHANSKTIPLANFVQILKKHSSPSPHGEPASLSMASLLEEEELFGSAALPSQQENREQQQQQQEEKHEKESIQPHATTRIVPTIRRAGDKSR